MVATEHHVAFMKALKARFPAEFQRATDRRCTFCIPPPPAPPSTDLARLPSAWLGAHVLSEDGAGEGWFRCFLRDLAPSLIVEETRRGRGEAELKLLSGPGYQPSFRKGLHIARIEKVLYGVNKNFQQYKMYLLDRPLIPKYTRAKLTPDSVGSVSSRSSSGVSSQLNSSGRSFNFAGALNGDDDDDDDGIHLVDVGEDRPTSLRKATAPPSTATTRVLSSTSLRQCGRPYSTSSDDRCRRPSAASVASSVRSSSVMATPQSSWAKKQAAAQQQQLQRKALKAAPSTASTANIKTPSSTSSSSVVASNSSGPRQWSADSGIEEGEQESLEAKFILPPRITTYIESECYLMSLPRCEQFVTHLARNLRPMMEELRFTNRDAKAQLRAFAPRLHRLAQEQFIAFPRSANLVNNSPRFQEFLRLAVENVIMRFVHDRIFPVVRHLSAREDAELLWSAEHLHRGNEGGGLSAERLGLRDDFCVPLPTAVVEMASLDMRSTPLDRLTCFYDAVQQVGAHIREAVLAARADSDDKAIPDDLPSPSDHDMVLLLATVIVAARPAHLMATLNYADLFAWSVPIDMIEVVSLVNSAADFVRNIQPKTLLPASGRLKREISMEEIIQLTDEVQQKYDRQGNRVEPLRSALDLHRERFAQSLEKSSADRARRQEEEAWARLDRAASPTDAAQQMRTGRFRRGLLASIHTKLICSTDPADVVEPK